MALPDTLAGLLRPAAYPHPVRGIDLVETHISWVLLTGDYAYKIKKPVHLPFVDFSSLERRHACCLEELRCNRPFAPDLYLDVVGIANGTDGVAAITAVRAAAGGAPATAGVFEWAVRMRQFPPGQELDRLLEAGALTPRLLRDFGVRLGRVHAGLPRRTSGATGAARHALAPVKDNFTTLDGLTEEPVVRARIARIRAATDALTATVRGRFGARHADGFTRECHGDLHLRNLVLIDGAVVAFDCLEFDPELRWIDTMCDVAFLVMDCAVRGRTDLAYAFLDGYLDETGDYAGVVLLPFYAAYRALVRAKVAGIEAGQRRADPTRADATRNAAAYSARMQTHLEWAERLLHRVPGRVILMSGVSGSGKSWLATRLAEALPAVRIRSDVARRHLEMQPGRDDPPKQTPHQMADARHVDAGRYAPGAVGAVYDLMGELVDAIVPQGETVILDATFIEAARRRSVVERARRGGWPVVIVACSAPQAILEARVNERATSGADPSEADLAVLHAQLARIDQFAPDEPVVAVDTTGEFGVREIAELVARIERRASTA
jgi:aminoglycoside phosphotransferase family enzyme/predicted kinase